MKIKEQRKVGIVLLAAGQASRMGMPKQLLVHQQEPLIRHMISMLLTLGPPVSVVLGARAGMINSVIADLPVQIVVNPAWEKGMGTSLKAGLEVFRKQTDGVLFCVVDQPYLTPALLKTYLEQFQADVNFPQTIIAARYSNGQLGVPAIFGADWYEALAGLAPGEGARKLIRKENEKLIPIDFPKGIFDLDRPEDWEIFRKE